MWVGLGAPVLQYLAHSSSGKIRKERDYGIRFQVLFVRSTFCAEHKDSQNVEGSGVVQAEHQLLCAKQQQNTYHTRIRVFLLNLDKFIGRSCRSQQVISCSFVHV